jgi:L-rhamnose mutarotase
MVETLKEVGIHNYSIFRHGLTLFGYFETHAIHKGWGKGPLRTLIVMMGKTTCSRIG